MVCIAYGAYGVSTVPDFDLTLLPLLKRGFGICYIHCRGGSELGTSWHVDGNVTFIHIYTYLYIIQRIITLLFKINILPHYLFILYL